MKSPANVVFREQADVICEDVRGRVRSVARRDSFTAPP
jgi:hypothetical protein